MQLTRFVDQSDKCVGALDYLNCDQEEQTSPDLSDQEIVDLVRNVPQTSSVDVIEKKIIFYCPAVS